MAVKHRVRKSPDRLTRAGLEILATALMLAVLALGPALAANKKAPAGRPPTPVTTAKAEARDLPYSLAALGRVHPSSLVEITPQVSGLVKAAHFQEGAYVDKGQLLFTLDPESYQVQVEIAKATLAKDLAQLKDYRQQLKRNAQMVKQNFVSRQDYEKIQAQAEGQAAQVEADRASLRKAELDLRHCRILAPHDGLTGKILIYPGNQVTSGTGSVLVKMADLTPAFIDFTLPESELPMVRKYQARGPLFVTAQVPGRGAATGKLVFISAQVRASTGTIELRARFDNIDHGLWPGAFVPVELALFTQKKAVVVPVQAAQQGPRGKIVYVIVAGKAQLRQIETERQAGDLLVVKKGVKPGETVVIDGHGMLYPGASVVEKTLPSLAESLKKQKASAGGK